MPLVPVSERCGYTLEEVAQHKNEKSCWIIVNRKVYDVTTFVKRHPGGPAVLLQMGGKDATAAAAASHKNALPANLMWEFCIGSLVRYKVAKEKPAAQKPLILPAAPPKAKAAAGPAAKASAAANRPKPGTPLGAPAAPKAAAKASSALKSPPRKSIGQASGANGVTFGKQEDANSDAIDEDQLSSKDDLDEEFAKATAGEESLKATVSSLIELLEQDSSLRRYVAQADLGMLHGYLEVFLGAAFDGAKWPGITVKRSVVETHFPDVVAALWDAMKGPLPLGEDTISAAVGKLSVKSGDAFDPRVAKFFDALRDCVSTGARLGKRRTMLRKRTSEADVLGVISGMWVTPEGQIRKIENGMCWYDGKNPKPFTSVNGAVTLDGWAPHPQGADRLLWQKNGTVSEWRRPEASGSTRASPPGSPKLLPPMPPEPKAPVVRRSSVTELFSGGSPTQSPRPGGLKVSDGLWENSEGLRCTVQGEQCTFILHGSQRLTLVDGVSTLNGWQAVKVDRDSVHWSKKGKTMQWARLSDVAAVAVLNGIWKNSEGLMATVADGQCIFSAQGQPTPVTIVDGLPSLNGWRAMAILENSVSWTKNGKSMEWMRLQDVSQIPALDGEWKTSNGLQVQSKAGTCDFGGKSAQITMEGGLPSLNGWICFSIRTKTVLWKRTGSKTLEWTRIR